MADIMAQPYAEWLEEALQEMVGLDPQTIGIVFIRQDGSTGTLYYEADNRDRLIMCESIMLDYVEAFLRANAREIAEILNDDEYENSPGGE